MAECVVGDSSEKQCVVQTSLLSPCEHDRQSGDWKGSLTGDDRTMSTHSGCCVVSLYTSKNGTLVGIICISLVISPCTPTLRTRWIF